MPHVDRTAMEAYNGILAKYDTSKSLDLTYDLHILAEGEEAMHIKNCRYMRAGKAYYSKIEDITIVGLPPYVLQLNTKQKVVHVAPYTPLPSVFTAPGLQLLMEHPERFTLQNVSARQNQISIQTGDFSLNAIRLTYNALTNEIEEYTTEHQEEAAYGEFRIIKSQYRSTLTSQQFSADSLAYDELRLSNYFSTPDSSKLQLTGQYSQWTLMKLTQP